MQATARRVTEISRAKIAVNMWKIEAEAKLSAGLPDLPNQEKQ